MSRQRTPQDCQLQRPETRPNERPATTAKQHSPIGRNNRQGPFGHGGLTANCKQTLKQASACKPPKQPRSPPLSSCRNWRADNRKTPFAIVSNTPERPRNTICHFSSFSRSFAVIEKGLFGLQTTEKSAKTTFRCALRPQTAPVAVQPLFDSVNQDLSLQRPPIAAPCVCSSFQFCRLFYGCSSSFERIGNAPPTLQNKRYNTFETTEKTESTARMVIKQAFCSVFGLCKSSEKVCR